MATTDEDLKDAALDAYRKRMRKLEIEKEWLAEVAAKFDIEDRTAEALMIEAEGYAEGKAKREAKSDG